MLKFLNSKEKKPIIEFLKTHWGFTETLNFAFLENEKDSKPDRKKIYVVNKEVDDLNLSDLRVNSIGLYLGEWKNDELRLSIDGSQLIGPKASMNIVSLEGVEIRDWLRGLDLEKESDCMGFVILKNSNDYFGCGRIKEGKILNFVPKARRIRSVD